MEEFKQFRDYFGLYKLMKSIITKEEPAQTLKARLNSETICASDRTAQWALSFRPPTAPSPTKLCISTTQQKRWCEVHTIKGMMISVFTLGIPKMV